MTDLLAASAMTEFLYPLSERECRRLLRRGTLGRVGMTSAGLPMILPVHYSYDDGFISFRTGAGTKLRAVTSGDVLAFRVDEYDARLRRGWSVMVLGRATIEATTHDHERLPTVDGPRVRAEHNYCVRLFCEVVTGQTIQTYPEWPRN